MTRIKICGIKDVETVRLALEYGVNFIGLVFASSRRQISLLMAQKITAAVHVLQPEVPVAGVFVNLPAGEVNDVARQCSLDYVQLSGDESWKYCLDVEKPVIKVIHVPETKTAGEIMAEIKTGKAVLGRKPFFCLLDTGSSAAYGGTGKSFNWETVQQITPIYPVMVAGGLNHQNVGQLIRKGNPWGVDVSSGVEINGVKNPGLMKEFITSVRKFEQRGNKNETSQ